MVGALSLVLPKIGTEFLPPLEEGALAINVVRLPTASVEGSAVQCTEIEKRLLAKFPEVTTVVSKTGRAEISEDPMGPEQSDLLIMLKPKDQWSKGMTKEKLVREISLELAAIPGLRPAFSQPIALRVNELLSGIKSDVAIKIIGDDMDRLRETGEKIAPILAGIEGAEDVKIEQVSGFTQLEVQHKREAMARHKINAEDINSLIETAVGGKVATAMFEGQRRFDVLVRFPEDKRNTPDRIGSLMIPSPAGYNVPLSELAEIEEIAGSRPDQPRGLDAAAAGRVQRPRPGHGFLRGRGQGEARRRGERVAHGLSPGLGRAVREPAAGHGPAEDRRARGHRADLPAAVHVAGLGQERPAGADQPALRPGGRHPGHLPAGHQHERVGGHRVHRAVRRGRVQRPDPGELLRPASRRQGMSVQEAVFEACRLRVRPLMMTSLAVLLGLIPMLFSSGSGSEIQRPLVAVIFGGMVSSLALTLIILPVLYALVNGRKEQVA